MRHLKQRAIFHGRGQPLRPSKRSPNLPLNDSALFRQATNLQRIGCVLLEVIFDALLSSGGSGILIQVRQILSTALFGMRTTAWMTMSLCSLIDSKANCRFLSTAGRKNRRTRSSYLSTVSCLSSISTGMLYGTGADGLIPFLTVVIPHLVNWPSCIDWFGMFYFPGVCYVSLSLELRKIAGFQVFEAEPGSYLPKNNTFIKLIKPKTFILHLFYT